VLWRVIKLASSWGGGGAAWASTSALYLKQQCVHDSKRWFSPRPAGPCLGYGKWPARTSLTLARENLAAALRRCGSNTVWVRSWRRRALPLIEGGSSCRVIGSPSAVSSNVCLFEVSVRAGGWTAIAEPRSKVTSLYSIGGVPCPPTVRNADSSHAASNFPSSLLHEMQSNERRPEGYFAVQGVRRKSRSPSTIASIPIKESSTISGGDMGNDVTRVRRTIRPSQ